MSVLLHWFNSILLKLSPEQHSETPGNVIKNFRLLSVYKLCARSPDVISCILTANLLTLITICREPTCLWFSQVVPVRLAIDMMMAEKFMLKDLTNMKSIAAF